MEPTDSSKPGKQSTKKSVAKLLSSTRSKNGVSEPRAEKKPDARTSFTSIMSPRSAQSSRAARQIEEKRMHELPVSKVSIEAVLIKLDPRKTIVSKLNPRIQSLMDRENPKIIEMKASMLLNGQLEPAWARPIERDGEVWHEVFVGSTRRFIALWITEESEQLYPLMAWVGKVPDVDAKRMARVENKDRHDLSFWEKCMDAKNNTADPGVAQLSLTDQANLIGMSTGAYSEALSTVNTIPPQFVEQLISPNLLTSSAARRMLKTIKTVDDMETYTGYVLQILAADKTDSVAALEQAMEVVATVPHKVLAAIKDLTILFGQSGAFINKGIIAGASVEALAESIIKDSTLSLLGLKEMVEELSRVQKKKKPWVRSDGGKVKAKMTAHRTNAGQYKLDLYDMSKEEIDRLQFFLDQEI
jgi:hypothetical protein